MRSSPPPARPTHPERIGHRGAPREFHENTIPSFVRALELGADAVELDVHCTSDGVVVVHHDPALSGSITGGEAVEIARVPWVVLRQFELEPDVTIPPLDEVLDLLGRSATAYVEIKGKAIERAVVDTVRRHDAKVAIHSFDHEAVGVVLALAPTIPTGVLVEDASVDPIDALTRVGARDLWPHHSLIDDSLVRRAHDVGGRVIAWTVNAPAEVSRLVSLGVDGICTDTLELLRFV